MKYISIISVLALLTPSIAFSHSGDLDKNGGHNCSDESKRKNLCTGYHYHRAAAVADKAKFSVNEYKSIQKTPN